MPPRNVCQNLCQNQCTRSRTKAPPPAAGCCITYCRQYTKGWDLNAACQLNAACTAHAHAQAQSTYHIYQRHWRWPLVLYMRMQCMWPTVMAIWPYWHRPACPPPRGLPRVWGVRSAPGLPSAGCQWEHARTCTSGMASNSNSKPEAMAARGLLSLLTCACCDDPKLPAAARPQRSLRGGYGQRPRARAYTYRDIGVTRSIKILCNAN